MGRDQGEDKRQDRRPALGRGPVGGGRPVDRRRPAQLDARQGQRRWAGLGLAPRDQGSRRQGDVARRRPGQRGDTTPRRARQVEVPVRLHRRGAGRPRLGEAEGHDRQAAGRLRRAPYRAVGREALQLGAGRRRQALPRGSRRRGRLQGEALRQGRAGRAGAQFVLQVQPPRRVQEGDRGRGAARHRTRPRREDGPRADEQGREGRLPRRRRGLRGRRR